jgi:hypothetical protein
MRCKRVLLKLDPEVIGRIREIVGRRDVSAFVNWSLEHEIRLVEWKQLAAEIDAERGPVPPEIEAEADALWRDIMSHRPRTAS